MAKGGGKFAIHTLNYALYTVLGVGPVLAYAYFSGPSKTEVETGLMSKYKINQANVQAKNQKLEQFWKNRSSDESESQYQELLKGGRGSMKRQHELTGQLAKLEQAQKALKANPQAEQADKKEE